MVSETVGLASCWKFEASAANCNVSADSPDGRSASTAFVEVRLEVASVVKPVNRCLLLNMQH